MGHGICVFVLLFWPTSQTGVGIREIRGIVPRPSRLLGSTLALPEYREGACRTRQVSWGYQETLSRCNRGRPGYLQPTSVLHVFFCVCVCVRGCVWVCVYVCICVQFIRALRTCYVYVLCHVHYHEPIFTTLRIHDNLLLLMSRASLGAAA